MRARTLQTWIARRIGVRRRLERVCTSSLLFLMVVTTKHSLEEAARFSRLHTSQFSKMLKAHSNVAVSTLESLSKKHAKHVSKVRQKLKELPWHMAIVVESTAIPGRPQTPVMTPISQVAFRKPPCDNPPLTETIERFDVVILGVDMGFIAPKERKHLSADALFGFVRSLFANVPDHRSDETDMTLTDALMAGFAMFSLTCPSLLDFDKQRAEGNVNTIYRIARAPCDSYMREMLDPVAPESLRPLFTGVFRQLQRGKALEEMVFFKGCYLLALDGTGYFASKTIHCQSCLEKHHRDGSITYAHQLLGAALIHPDWREVIPLMPEAIIKHDGSEKNDGERNAAKRFIATLRQDHPHLGFIVTEDGLSSNAPHIETLRDYGCHSILGVKEGDHGSLFAQVQAAEQARRVSHYERHDRAAGIAHRFRCINDMPLNESRPDVRVNFIEYWEVSQDQVQYLSWVTDFRVHKDNVYKLMRGGRARWKIENETCNTLVRRVGA